MRRGGAWERQFAPLIAEHVRTKRHGQAGKSWDVDETDVRVKGKWWYLSRASDTDGNLVASRLSEKRDREAAQVFFRTRPCRGGSCSGTSDDRWPYFLSTSSA